ncbi:MAG: Usg family protein [Pseudomonadota bacterium]
MSTSLMKQLQGFSLTTAEIYYHLPDHPNLIQSYIWQDYDQAPEFPVLSRFLDFWRRDLEGPLHSVNVMCRKLIAPNEVRLIKFEHLH